MARGAYIFAPLGPQLSPIEAAFFADADPFGFILFARNCENPDQLRKLTDDLRAALGWNAPIFIDQEGGRVTRLAALDVSEWLPPLDDAARLAGDAVAGFALRYAIISGELRALGIDGNCSPIGDVAQHDTHAVLKNRCYGTEPGPVIELARAVAEAQLRAGVLPVMKHMPGHGRASLDSHHELPRVSEPRATLWETDFAVFQALNDLPIGMTAHVVYEDFTDEPATTSSQMISLIRDDIGFDGLLMTDDISMNALSGNPLSRSQAALSAGCDLVLHCNGDMDEMSSIATVGQMTPAAAVRAAYALDQRRAPQPVDIARLKDDFATLSGRAG